MRRIGLGIIGAGNSARRIHLPGFRLCPEVEIVAVCDPDEAAAIATGIPTRYTTPDQLLARPDIDAVVVATPNYTHHDTVIAAVVAGKDVLCEKPLALNGREAREMWRVAEERQRVHMTAFTYQFAPGLPYLKHIIDSGELGEVRTVRASYLMALSGHLLGWRSLKQHAGSGVLADIGSHVIHLTQFLCGPISAVAADTRRFRDDAASDVEDWVALLARFTSGASGTFEISRVCAGRGAAISEQMRIELYASAGTGVFATQDPWAVELCSGEAAENAASPLVRREVPREYLKLAGSPRDPKADDARWGYRYDEAFQFMENVRTRQSTPPSFVEGVRCQLVMDAVIRSAESRKWVEVEQFSTTHGSAASPSRRIVAAIIKRNGRVLICQRAWNKVQPLRWEFPGGKVEAGEDERAALIRELREELAIQADVGPEVARLQHTYSETGPLELIFYAVDRFGGDPHNRVFESIEWVEPQRLPEYDFLEADRDLLAKLAETRK
jgi:mutator protein MutT